MIYIILFFWKYEGDSYTLIRANMIAKIEAQNKSTNLKPTKSFNGNTFYIINLHLIFV